jgi:hypothetical protein
LGEPLRGRTYGAPRSRRAIRSITFAPSASLRSPLSLRWFRYYPSRKKSPSKLILTGFFLSALSGYFISAFFVFVFV